MLRAKAAHAKQLQILSNSSTSGNSSSGSKGGGHRKTNKPGNRSHGKRPDGVSARASRGNHKGNHRGRPGPGKGKRGKEIAREKYLNTATVPEAREEYVAKHNFADFGFDERLQRNIAAHGYVTPTQIQDVAIKPIMERRDLLGLANTGTGKTAAFVLPIIQRLLTTDGKNDALIITPTRELAAQIEDEFRAFAKGLKLY